MFISFPPGVSNLLASLGHTGRRSVVVGHTLNILQHVITKKSHNVLSKFTILCWTAFIAMLSNMQPTGRRLDTPAPFCSVSLLWSVSPQNSYVELLTPNAMILGGKASGRWLSHESRVLVNGIHALILKKTKRALSLLLPYYKNTAIWEPGSEPAAHVSAVIMEFPDSTTE